MSNNPQVSREAAALTVLITQVQPQRPDGGKTLRLTPRVHGAAGGAVQLTPGGRSQAVLTPAAMVISNSIMGRSPGIPGGQEGGMPPPDPMQDDIRSKEELIAVLRQLEAFT